MVNSSGFARYQEYKRKQDEEKKKKEEYRKNPSTSESYLNGYLGMSPKDKQKISYEQYKDARGNAKANEQKIQRLDQDKDNLKLNQNLSASVNKFEGIKKQADAEKKARAEQMPMLEKKIKDGHTLLPNEEYIYNKGSVEALSEAEQKAMRNIVDGYAQKVRSSEDYERKYAADLINQGANELKKLGWDQNKINDYSQRGERIAHTEWAESMKPTSENDAVNYLYNMATFIPAQVMGLAGNVVAANSKNPEGQGRDMYNEWNRLNMQREINTEHAMQKLGDRYGAPLNTPMGIMTGQNPAQILYSSAESFGEQATTMALTYGLSEALGVAGAGEALKAAGADQVTPGLAKAAQVEKLLESASLLPYGQQGYYSGYKKAREEGASETGAELRGIASGLAEIITEKYSMGNLWDIARGTKVGRNLIINGLVQMGVEDTEEMASDLLNDIADGVISKALNDKLSDYDQRVADYVAQGENEKIAKGHALVDKVIEYLGDGFMGAIAGGTAGVSASVQGYRASKTNKARDQFYSNNLAKYEGNNEYEVQVNEDVDRYKQNPTRFYAESIDDSVEDNKRIKADLMSYADQVDSGLELSMSDRADIENLLGEAQRNNQFSKYKGYSEEIANVPTEYRTAVTNISVEEATAQMNEAAQNGDVEAMGEIYHKMQSARSSEVKAAADETFDRFVGMAENNGASAEALESAKISSQEAYLKGLRGETIESSINQNSRQEIAFNEGTKARLINESVTLEDSALKYEKNPAMQRQYIENYTNELTVQQYNQAFNTLVPVGKARIPFENLKNNGKYGWLIDRIGEEKAKQIYNIGLEQANAEAELKARKDAARVFKYRMGNTFTDARTDKSNKIYNAFFDYLANAGSVDVEYYNKGALDTETDKGVRANFSAKAGVIRITEGAEQDSFHELTHLGQVFAPEEYKKLKPLILESAVNSYGETVFTDLMHTFEHTYKNATADEITDELVASIMVGMMHDESSWNEFGRVLAKNYTTKEAMTIKEKIVDFFNRILDGFRSIIRNATNMTETERLVMENSLDKQKEIIKQYSKMLDKAFQERKKALFQDNVVEIDEGDILLSMATKDASMRALNDYLEDSDLTKTDKQDIRDHIEWAYGIAKKFTNNKDLVGFNQWQQTGLRTRDNGDGTKTPLLEVYNNGKPVRSVIVNNGEYPLNIDFSQVCKKRIALNDVLNKLVSDASLNIRILNEKDISGINDIIKQHNFEIACGLCFVDAKRYRVGRWANTFVNGDKKKGSYGWNRLVKSLAPRNVGIDYFAVASDHVKPLGTLLTEVDDSQLDFTLVEKVYKPYLKEDGTIGQVIIDGKKSNPNIDVKMAYLLRHNPEFRKLLDKNDIIASEGLDALRENYLPVYNLLNAHGGTAKPKLSHGFTAYGGDIAKARNFTPENAYKVGGVRVQSFSDYVANLFFDYMQMFADMAARKLPSHAYTKEIDYVKLYGMTGQRINMSVIFKGADLTDAQQKRLRSLKTKAKILADPEFSELASHAGLDADGNYIIEDESIDFEKAKEIRKNPDYKYCGTIGVGLSDPHIRKMLNDPDFDMVIPYHSSGVSDIIKRARNLVLYTDYTSVQNTRGADGKKVDGGDGFAWYDYLKSDNSDGYDAKTVADMYLKHCDENGYIPKFDKFRDEPNYYKLLIDFRAYDNDGNFMPQGAVKMNFPENFESIVKESLIAQQEVDGRRQAELNDAQDSLYREVKDYLKKSKVLEETDVRYSKDTDSDGNKLTENQVNFFKNSKVRDEDGNLRVVYHGTSENFTVFDRTKTRANMDIQGMFFSPYDIDAEGYGNTKAYYLNIANPADESTAIKALMKFKGQNGAGIKARELLVSQGYDGVYNGYDEYIAFEPNQIKLIDNLNPTENEDIRFSKDTDIDDDLLDDAMFESLFDNGFIDELEDELDVKKHVNWNWMNDLMDSLEESIKAAESGTKRERKKAQRHLTKAVVGKEFVTNGKKVAFKDERIDKYLASFAASNKDYAQAYITYMSPTQFLLLTANGDKGSKTFEWIKEGSHPFNEAEFLEETQPIFLDLDEKGNGKGEIVGHEGRHRMFAFGKAGFSQIPVLVFNFRNKYDKHHIDSITLTPQKYNYETKYNKSNLITLTDLEPLSTGNRDTIIAKFGSGAEADVRYSKDTDGKELTPEQVEYFKDSKVRDESGALKVMYHGTDVTDFTIFDPEKSDDKISLFFTDNIKVAGTYERARKGVTYFHFQPAVAANNPFKVYINLKNPYIVEGDKYISSDGKINFKKDEKEIKISFPLLENNGYLAGSNYIAEELNTFYFDKNEMDKALEFLKSKVDDKSYNDILEQINKKRELYSSREWDEKEIHLNLQAGKYESALIKDVLKPYSWSKVPFGDGTSKTRDISKWAKENGYDGVIFKNMYDGGNYERIPYSDVVVAFDSNQVKSVNNKKPTDDPDIRYSKEMKPLDLAARVYDFASDFDYYQTYDAVGEEGMNEIDAIAESISKGEVGYFIDTIEDILYDDDLDMLPETRTNGEQILNALKSFGGTRYSLVERDDYITEDYEAPVEESILKEGLAYLKKTNIDKKLVSKVAKQLIQENGSQISLTELTNNISKAFAYMKHVDHLSYKDAARIMEEVARPILEQSNTMVGEEEYKTFINSLKGKIKLSDKQISEVKAMFGSYGEYKSLMSPLNINLNGTVTLDQMWESVVENSFGKLDLDTSEADMPFALYDALKGLRPSPVNNYGGDIDDVAKDVGMRIIEEYFKNQADEKIKKYSQKLDDNLKKYKENVRKKAKNNALKKAETVRANKVKKSIEQNVVKLQKWIANPSEEHHVPMDMVEPILEFMTALDFVEPEIKTDGKTFYVNIFDHMEYHNGKKSPQYIRIEGKTKAEVRDKFYAQLDRGIGSARQRTWVDRMRAIKDLYDEAVKGNNFTNSDVTDFASQLDGSLVDELSELIKNANGKIYVNDFDSKQLTVVDKVIKNIIQVVNRGNKAAAQNEDIKLLSEDTISRSKGKVMSDSSVRKWFVLDMATPLSYFDNMGDGASKIYRGLRNGFNTKIRDIRTASEFMKNLIPAKKAKNWTGNNPDYKSFNIGDRKIDLTVAQIMSLYELVKRDQTLGHLKGGFTPTTFKTGKFNKVTHNLDERPVHLTNEEIVRITDTLTDEQKRVADEMQHFLADTCSGWGNEVSRNLYGYEKFLDPNYFPITSDKNYLMSNNENTAFDSLNGIERSGFTKQVIKNASNPIVIADIFDVFTKHVNDMATYHGFAAPIKDANRWFNYKTVESLDEDVSNYSSVKDAISRLSGQGGQQYYIKLIKDLNGMEKSQYIAAFTDKVISGYKSAAVGANIRVVIQQPTAYFRAANIIDPKYLASALVSPREARRIGKMMREQSEIAWWKSQGYFETSIGRSMKNIITGQERVSEKVKDALMLPAGVADDLTWGVLYTAVAKEQSALGLKGDELEKAIKERFDEVVDQTQVVDSTLHRSQLMRSQDMLNKLQTAFMAEPIKSYNMLMRAAMTKDKNKITRAAMTFVVTNVITAAAASLVDAFRRDDDDKDWGEEYVKAFEEGVIDNVNPLNLMPIIKDVSNTFIGFIMGTESYQTQSNRMDLDAINSLFKSSAEIVKYAKGDSNKTTYGIIMTALRPLSQLTGIPLYNLTREASALYNALFPDLKKTISTNQYAEVYDLIKQGKDVDRIKEAVKKVIEKGGSLSDIKSGISSRYKSDYFDMYQVDPNEAQKLGEKAARGYAAIGMDDEEIEGIIDSWKEESITYPKLYKAIMSGEGIEEQIDKLREAGKEDDKIAEKVADKFFDTIVYADENEISSPVKENTDKAIKYITGMDFDSYIGAEEQAAIEKEAEKAAKTKATAEKKAKAEENKAIKQEKTGHKQNLYNNIDNGGDYKTNVEKIHQDGTDYDQIKSLLTKEYKGKNLTQQQKSRIATIKAYCDEKSGTKIAKKYNGNYYQYELDEINKW